MDIKLVNSENEIINIMKEPGENYIYGIGYVGTLLYNRCKDNINNIDKNITVSGFIISKRENDIVKKNSIPILSLDEYITNNKNGKIIVSVIQRTQSEIIDLLIEYDLSSSIYLLSNTCINEMAKNQCIKVEGLYNRIDELENNYIRMIPKPAINVSFHLVDNCNLNCKGCWHFSPLARNFDNVTADIKEFEKDVERMANVMEGEITLFTLFGGEPLLHPEAHLFPYIVKKYLPDTYVDFFTNGLLLNNMNEAFWKSCRDNDVCIQWTKYPVSKDDGKLTEKLLREKKVKYNLFCGEETKCLTKDVLDLEAIGSNGQRGRNDARWQWLHCYKAGDCVQLKNHRLYPCTTASNAWILKQKFNLSIRLSKFDSIDIYEAKNKDEILTFLSKPIPFCRYCNVQKSTDGHIWSQSNYSISEWTEMEY